MSPRSSVAYFRAAAIAAKSLCPTHPTHLSSRTRNLPSPSHRPHPGPRPYYLSSTSTSSTAADPANYGEYCVELVKQHDFDAYLCGLLVPTPSRRAFFALRAFNVETALIKDVARGNALPGQMRMQWWREVIGAIYQDKSPAHPVARALAEAVQAHNLTRRWLDRLLEARLQDLDNIQPTTMADLEDYAEHTASSLLYLTLESLGVQHQTADHAASHVGKATGITTLLRATRYHAAQQSLYIPLELQREFKVNVNDILRGPQSPEAVQALSDVFFEVATQAHLHLEHARELLSSTPSPATGPLPKATFTALLPAVRTTMYLEALQKSGFDALDEGLLPRSHLGFQMRLWWANWRRKI
ncbi:nadh dehydrogenase complex assembly factor 6 [Nannochloropsis oceanica]